MALDFPNTPSDGEEFSAEGTVWVYSAATRAWNVKSQLAGAAPVTPVYDGLATYGWDGTWGGFWASLTDPLWDPSPIIYGETINYLRWRQVNQAANFIFVGNAQPNNTDVFWIDTFVFEDLGTPPVQGYWNNNNQYLVYVSTLLIPVMPDYDGQRGFFRVYDVNPGIDR